MFFDSGQSAGNQTVLKITARGLLGSHRMLDITKH